MAGAFPWLGAMLACKPNVALVALAGARDRRTALLAAGGALAFALATLVIDPTWPARWLAATRTAHHVRPLASYWFGVPLLLALPLWRTDAGRVLAALALVPLTPASRDALLLFPCAFTPRQLALIALGTWVAVYGLVPLAAPTFDAFAVSVARAMTFAVYLPALVMAAWNARRRLTSPT